MASSFLPWGQFRFDTVSRLGSGGLGYVDRVRVSLSNWPQKPVGSDWACKRLHSQWVRNPIMLERFRRERTCLQQMSHDNIISWEGENLEGQAPFYLMPLYGNTLRTHIASNHKRGDWRFIAHHGAVLADALHYAHCVGFLHRDLKPDNILFNTNGPLVIADWGLGYFVHQNSVVIQPLTRGGMGTEYYCCLEQWTAAARNRDPRIDVYSLGMTLDEWATGHQRKINVGAGVNGPAVGESTEGARHFNQVLRWMTTPFKANRLAQMDLVAQELRAALVAA